MTSNAGQREKVRLDKRCCGRRRRRKDHVLSPARTPYPRGKGEEERVIKEGGGRPAGGSGVPRQVGRIYTGLRWVGGGRVGASATCSIKILGSPGKRKADEGWDTHTNSVRKCKTVLVFIVAPKQYHSPYFSPGRLVCILFLWPMDLGRPSAPQAVRCLYIRMARGFHFCKAAFCRRCEVFLRVSSFFEKAPGAVQQTQRDVFEARFRSAVPVLASFFC